uniref:Ubiquitin specific peptidase 18 n=1 Tax=Neolamprologus brichardi TaxID=32507 RepID=A0A3Q4H713_NEOBR
KTSFWTKICCYLTLVTLTGMRGLSNYCLSCCVNSLLQTFSATWEIAVYNINKGDARNVALHLKRVLEAMRGDLPQLAPHRDFLHCLDQNRFRRKINVQHDADEVFLSILNLIHQQMDNRVLAGEIQDLYKISVETHLQCLKCNSIQTETSYMLSFPLYVKEDDNSLEGCMNSFFEHQELKGINSCFCAHCGTKNSSRQGVKLLSLPRILCMNLKRFRNSRGSTHKLDCRVSFPETFDFSQSLQHVFSCRYTLYAVVVHSGYAMCGHYTAYVRHRENERWYYADDSYVQRNASLFSFFFFCCSRTAYMLMYRRDSEEWRPRPELSG